MKRKHHDLVVWQEAIGLVKDIYTVTAFSPKEEIYGLVSQIRRAAVSVPCNIAEGAARNSNKEFVHFLFIARGSLSELETQVIISKELGYIKDSSALTGRIDSVFGLIGGLINSIRKRGN